MTILDGLLELKEEETRIRRLNQMLEELKRGDTYMKMPYNAK